LAYLLFLDESGLDHQESPYEVLCGVAIHDSELWPLIQDIRAAELAAFGRRYRAGPRELKAKELLKRKTFRLAAQGETIPDDERRELATAALDDGATATRAELTAVGQAKLTFCRNVLQLCEGGRAQFFASVVLPSAPRSAAPALRKDYSYLLQRFYYFLEQHSPNELGLLVMDEVERAQAHIFVRQMEQYFQETQFGKARSKRIIPEPFFVHSELTTGVQIADLVAYLLSWNVRLAGMGKARRSELDEFGQMVKEHQRTYWVAGLAYPVRSFVFLRDLRSRNEKDLDSAESPAQVQLDLKAP